MKDSLIKVLLAVVLVICLGSILALSYTLPRTSLTPAELTQAKEACPKCHDDEDDYREHDLEDDAFEDGDVHQIHSNADCSTCHSGAPGLKAADSASRTLKWVSIGFLGVVVAGIALNYVVVIGRTKGREVDDGRQDD